MTICLNKDSAKENIPQADQTCWRRPQAPVWIGLLLPCPPALPAVSFPSVSSPYIFIAFLLRKNYTHIVGNSQNGEKKKKIASTAPKANIAVSLCLCCCALFPVCICILFLQIFNISLYKVCILPFDLIINSYYYTVFQSWSILSILDREKSRQSLSIFRFIIIPIKNGW